MTNAIITFANVTKAFNGRKILDNVTLEIEEGSVFGLIGPSGAGKTTLLRLLMGYYQPDSGSVTFADKKVKNATQIHKQIGFATQDECFYEDMTCMENLQYFGDLYGLSQKECRERSEELLRIVELWEHQDTIGEHLSGGMRRRLDIAIALLHKPRILILDEPTSGLDPLLRKHMLDLIIRIQQLGITILLTSHLLEELEQICTTVAIIIKGSCVAHGKPAEIIANYFPNNDIHIVTYPGNYQAVLDAIIAAGIPVEDYVIEKHEMYFTTAHADLAVYTLLRVLYTLSEQLIDIDIVQPTLTRVFEQLETAE